MFAADRDLLILEPLLLRDLAWTGQRPLQAVGSIAGSTLTLASGDLIAAGVSAGQVALVGGAALEIVQVLSAVSATVSLLRADPADPPVAPAPASDAPVSIFTFAPQIAAAHRLVLSMLGLDPDAPPGSPPGVGAESVLNPRALVRFECLLTLGALWLAAAAQQGAASAAAQRAEAYRRRAAQERSRIAALIDLDGDGRADDTRTPGVGMLRRA